jgi:hypothetical protein
MDGCGADDGGRAVGMVRNGRARGQANPGESNNSQTLQVRNRHDGFHGGNTSDTPSSHGRRILFRMNAIQNSSLLRERFG